MPIRSAAPGPAEGPADAHKENPLGNERVFLAADCSAA